MGWKDWPYWFKGGIISLLSSIIIAIVCFFINELSVKLHEASSGFWFITAIIGNLIFIPFRLVPPIFNLSNFTKAFCTKSYTFIGCLQWGIERYIIAIVFWIVLGIIIGYIYGKIKSRNQSPSE